MGGQHENPGQNGSKKGKLTKQGIFLVLGLFRGGQKLKKKPPKKKKRRPEISSEHTDGAAPKPKCLKKLTENGQKTFIPQNDFCFDITGGVALRDIMWSKC